MLVYKCITVLPAGETPQADDFHGFVPVRRCETQWLLVTPDDVPKIAKEDLVPTTRNADGSWNTRSGYRWVASETIGSTAPPADDAG